MKRGSLISAVVVAATVATAALAPLGTLEIGAQTATTPSFKSSVDMVRIAAVVRDHKGRFVQDLSARDFEVLDAGITRKIADFRHDVGGVSVAILFDVSGSMEGHLPSAREAAAHVLSWLDASRDEAAVFTFDTHLDEVSPFTTGLKKLPESMTGKPVRVYSAATASRAAGMPADGPYVLWPSRVARPTASTRWAGVRNPKATGSPMLR